jgi:hypothetical protein
MRDELIGKRFDAVVKDRRWHEETDKEGKPIWYPVPGTWEIISIVTGNPRLTYLCRDVDRPGREKWFYREEIPL